jgi:LysR family transcriptional regulator, pca operon transcriptional activator
LDRASGILNPYIKFRHLVCFLETARLKSVVKAADVLGISQPAASKTIQELEEALGVALFDRSRRTMALTGFGQVFLRFAGASVTALRQGIDSIDQARSLNEATVKVGALPTVSARILPKAVELFMAQHVGSKVRIVTGPTAFLQAQLRLGELDLVIGRMADPDVMTGFSFEHLYSEKIAFVVRPEHPLLSLDPFDFSAIPQFQILMPPPGSVIRPTVERFLISQGLGSLPHQIETVSTAFGRSYTRGSDAIWIISEGVTAEDVASRSLAHLPVDTHETLGPVGLTTRTDLPLSLAAELLVQTLRGQARTI